MLKIKVEQPLRKYVSLDSLPVGAVFIRRIDEEHTVDDRFFMKTKIHTNENPFNLVTEVCDAICLKDGTYYTILKDAEVREVKAELTINNFLT